jgi:hypothetical protein
MTSDSQVSVSIRNDAFIYFLPQSTKIYLQVFLYVLLYSGTFASLSFKP